MSRVEGRRAKGAAGKQASAAATLGRRFMAGRSGISTLDKSAILRCTLATLSNRPEPSFFQAEHAAGATRNDRPLQPHPHTQDRPRRPLLPRPREVGRFLPARARLQVLRRQRKRNDLPALRERSPHFRPSPDAPHPPQKKPPSPPPPPHP